MSAKLIDAWAIVGVEERDVGDFYISSVHYNFAKAEAEMERLNSLPQKGPERYHFSLETTISEDPHDSE